MLNLYPSVSPLKNLELTVLRMHRNSLPIAPVCPIQPTNTTWKQPTSSYDTLSSTSTGAHSKWSQPVSKLPQPETSPDKSSDIDLLAFKNFLNDTQILLETLRSLPEKPDCKTQKIVRTASPRMIQSYKHGGTLNKNS